jgi:hypothetical protein
MPQLYRSTKEMKKIAKYGFGMSPVSSKMQGRYDFSVETVKGLLEGDPLDNETVLEALSEFKGMLNRCIRQDQWDWYNVHLMFGSPPKKEMQRMVAQITMLRKAVKEENIREYGYLLRNLEHQNLRSLLKQFLQRGSDQPIKGGWIYILSTREQPDVLKIGMTTRSVTQRVKEINSATGVLFPFSVRAIFSVEDPAVTESLIFEALSEFRIRMDREFFQMSFQDATKLIEQVIEESIAKPEPGESGNGICRATT